MMQKRFRLLLKQLMLASAEMGKTFIAEETEKRSDY